MLNITFFFESFKCSNRRDQNIEIGFFIVLAYKNHLIYVGINRHFSIYLFQRLIKKAFKFRVPRAVLNLNDYPKIKN